VRGDDEDVVAKGAEASGKRIDGDGDARQIREEGLRRQRDAQRWRKVVGDTGFEPVTSRM
jgi:hypothetical protein